jgi:hypothetical protein
VAVNGCGKLDNPTSSARLAPYLPPTTAIGRSRTSVTGWSAFRRTANPYQNFYRMRRTAPSQRSTNFRRAASGPLRQAIPSGPHGPVIALRTRGAFHPDA